VLLYCFCLSSSTLIEGEVYMRQKVRELISVSPFIGLALLINVVIIVVPAFLTITLAFFEWDGLGSMRFVGVANFRSIFSQPIFLRAIGNNIIWMVIFMTIPMAIGLVVAELLRRTRWLFLKAIYFIPSTLAIVVIAFVWSYIYHPIRGLGALVGLPPVLGLPDTALYAIAFTNIWAWWGFLCAVFHSAIQGISLELYDAGALDGATRWQEFWYITLPQIKPNIVFMSIMTIIWSFQVFDWVWVTTEGGPGGATELLATLLFRRGFHARILGEAAAIGVIISLLGILAINLLFYLQRKGAEV